jgi:hypothetical protein
MYYAMQNGDQILIVDLMEYEILDLLGGLCLRLKELKLGGD